MDQLGSATLVITAVFFGVSSIFLALRLASRIFVAHNITLSDRVMLVGWVLVCSLSVAIFVASGKGVGLQEELPPEWVQTLAKAQYAFMVLYVGRRTIATINLDLTDRIIESCVDGHQILYSHLLPHSK